MRRRRLLRNQRHFLNLLAMAHEFVAKDACKIDIMQNDHVGVVLFMIVILPAFIPPTETDDRWPAI
jgi:hypothetical protein